MCCAMLCALWMQVWNIFPQGWHVPQLLCATFCNITKTQLGEILDLKVGGGDALHMGGKGGGGGQQEPVQKLNRSLTDKPY
jgi:hypothetical protein